MKLCNIYLSRQAKMVTMRTSSSLEFGHTKCAFEGTNPDPPKRVITWRLKMVYDRDRRDQKFRFDTDTDTFSGSRSIPRLILILKVGLNRDRYWYWYQENVPGLILIPRLYLIRILPKPYKKCTSLWIDTGTDTETQKQPRSRPILIPKALVSAFSIRYRYSRLSLVDNYVILLSWVWQHFLALKKKASPETEGW